MAEAKTGGLARFGPLGPAEQTMVDGVGNGVFHRVGAGGLQNAGDEDWQVRAELTRALLLGGEGISSFTSRIPVPRTGAQQRRV
jgi:hypothetical protein